MIRNRCWSNLPRAAATLLALLLSVVAGPRGNADDRRADGSRGEVAQVAPIHPLHLLEVRCVQPSGIASPDRHTGLTPVFVWLPLVPRSFTARPLRGTPVAARAP